MKELSERINEILDEESYYKMGKFTDVEPQKWEEFRNKWKSPNAEGDFYEELKQVFPNLHTDL